MMAKMLSREAFGKAVAYLRGEARPLEQALYEYHFEDGSRTNVLAALATYQNTDGGFGHALDPDLRTPASSVIATTIALGILREIGATEDTPGLPAALTYLMDSYDVASERWPIVPPAVEDAPHAPWWTYAESEETFHHFWANPRAAVVSYLWQFRRLVPSPFVESALESLFNEFMSYPQHMEMHDLLCFVDLLQTPGLPEETYQGLLDKLLRVLPRTVILDAEQWGDYNLKPIDVASTPDSPLATAFEPALLDRNLDYEIERQPADGVWGPSWSWDFVDANAWAAAEREYKGVLTLRRLKTLRAFGRIEGNS
jgi:hypothetical protein